MKTMEIGGSDNNEKALDNVKRETILDGFSDQYREAVYAWDHLPLAMRAPSHKAVDKWLSTLPDKTLKGLKKLGAEQLLLVPPGDPAGLIGKNIKIDGGATYGFWRLAGSANWKGAITKAKGISRPDQSILYKDYPRNRRMRINEEILEQYKMRFEMEGVGVMPIHGYIPTIMRRIRLDFISRVDPFFTIFERPDHPLADRVLFGDELPVACFAEGKLYLEQSRDIHTATLAQARPWVCGDIL